MPVPASQSAARPITDRLSQIGDGVRIRMLRVLEQEELAVGELARVLQIPQSSASRHLKVLLEGGWLHRRTAGPSAYFRLVPDDLPQQSRDLWIAVRLHASQEMDADQDDARLASAIADRRADSTSFFGRHAGRWDELRTELFGQRFTDQALLGLLNPAWTVADLGCGTGNAAELLAPWVSEVVAIDSSPEMLDAASRRLAEHQNIRFVGSDLTEPPVQPRSVDAAVCLLVLHHLESPEAVLERMAAMLRTSNGGGVALVVDMIPHDRADFRHEMGHQRLGFTPAEMRGMFEAAGFSHIRIRTLPPDTNASGPALFAATAHLSESTPGSTNGTRP